MKTYHYIALLSIPAVMLFNGCESALDPLANGHYTEDNVYEYPSLIKGFVDKAYSSLNNSYNCAEYVYLDCATDNGVATSSTQDMRAFANGSMSPVDGTFDSFWASDYDGIYYVNQYLKDDIGVKTQYLLDHQQDSLLKNNYKGDALALRAWFEYDLLLKFGGKSVDSTLLGFPITPVNLNPSTANVNDFARASYDECVMKILDDCDEALKYLPWANRAWLAKDPTVQGSVRWQRFDGVSITALKALTYLLWASDAFNPEQDITRWENAASCAYEALKFKLTEDAAHGFNPLSAFQWTDPNSPEIYWCSKYTGNISTMEECQYPNGFRGNAYYAPTQELVDAFPMANGYPITHELSGYDPNNPYAGRDPRFYSTVFFNGAKLYRNGKAAGEPMYQFQTYSGGKDAPGLTNNSLTGYYLKKFIYLGWNRSDQTIQTLPRCVFFIRWTDMCLAFAEAANRAWGPLDSRLGLSAKDALAFLRNRTTSDGEEGLGVKGDPYLDECCASKEAFEALVRNERRIETCFEGKRFFDLMRWDTPLDELNKSVHKMEIRMEPNGKLSYSTGEADVRKFNSKYLPIPYSEAIKLPNIVQNEGWDTWQKNK